MPRVLVIDDQTHARAAVILVLRAYGFDAVGAEDGVAGLREFQATEFDLAIVDIYMPGFDGVQLIKALRRHSPNLPVIAISGIMLRGSPRTALDFFPDLPALAKVICLQKPFRPPELLKAIQTALAVAA
jgi:CheY-like chemotaxis protein